MHSTKDNPFSIPLQKRLASLNIHVHRHRSAWKINTKTCCSCHVIWIMISVISISKNSTITSKGAGIEVFQFSMIKQRLTVGNIQIISAWLSAHHRGWIRMSSNSTWISTKTLLWRLWPPILTTIGIIRARHFYAKLRLTARIFLTKWTPQRKVRSASSFPKVSHTLNVSSSRSSSTIRMKIKNCQSLTLMITA